MIFQKKNKCRFYISDLPKKKKKCHFYISYLPKNNFVFDLSKKNKCRFYISDLPEKKTKCHFYISDLPENSFWSRQISRFDSFLLWKWTTSATEYAVFLNRLRQTSSSRTSCEIELNFIFPKFSFIHLELIATYGNNFMLNLPFLIQKKNW